MRLLDRIALQRLITLILNFILAIIKLFVPQSIEEDNPDTKPPKKWRPRWKKNK